MAQAKGPSADRFPFYVAAAFSLLLWLLVLLQALSPIDQKWVDQMFRWRGMENGDPRITVVTIDDESIEHIGQYPWPRSVYPRLLDRLYSAGVKVVALDILFLDPSLPQEDAALIEATRRAGDRLVHSINRDPSIRQENAFRRPFPGLAKAAKSIGSVDQLLIDPDGMARRSYLMFGKDISDYRKWPTDAERVPSLALKALSLFEGRPPDDYLRDRDDIIVLNMRGQKTGTLGQIRDKNGNLVPIIAPVYGIRRIGAWKVLEGKLEDRDRAALKGGIVFVGSTAIGAFDHFPTPFTEQAPGVEVHANIIDNLLNHRELSGVPAWVTLLLILAFALLASQTLELGPLAATASVLGLFLAWTGFTYWMFLRLRVMDYAAPSLALLGTFAVLMIRKTLLEGREKRFIKQTFGQFVAPEVVNQLVKDPSLVKLGGEKREMTVFFLDIAHFTTISEKMKAEDLILFLNKYLSALSAVIHHRKGTVDKYIGDCIMAFWNAPLDDKDHRANAGLAAVECQEVMDRLNKDLDPNLPEVPAIRIGLNSGDMTVGLTGSEKKLAYTVIGDEVNLASRLEGANKFFGSKIMVSEACFNGAKDASEGRVLGKVRVVGKNIPIKVYELLGKKGQLTDAWKKALPRYDKGVESFVKGDFVAAKAEFEEVVKIFPDDKPTKVYLNLVEDYLAIPPAAEWDVFNLTAK